MHTYTHTYISYTNTISFRTYCSERQRARIPTGLSYQDWFGFCSSREISAATSDDSETSLRSSKSAIARSY